MSSSLMDTATTTGDAVVGTMRDDLDWVAGRQDLGLYQAKVPTRFVFLRVREIPYGVHHID